MLLDICRKLEKWVATKNTRRIEEGTLSIPPCEIYVIGQTALLEAGLGISIAASMEWIGDITA